MQLKSNKLYPYPLLWAEKDDYIENTDFDLKLSVNTIGPVTHFSIFVELKNEEIMEYIKNEKVDVVCHFECPKTKYRSSLQLSIGENNIRIDSNLINGKVEIVAVLRNNVDLINFSNSKFNDLYKNIRFNIPAYSTIAVSSFFEAFIEKELDTLANISSFISIIPNHNEKKTIIDCASKDKIYVKLPTKVYNQYYAISGNADLNNEIFSILIVPALMEAFLLLIEQDDLLLFDDYRWYRGLSKVFKRVYKKDLTITILKESSLFELAQGLMDNPINMAFEKILER